MWRRRLAHLSAAALAVPVALATRRPELAGTMIGTYGGDVLWSFALYQVLRIAWARLSPRRAGVLCMGISALVEISQLYHAPWLDALRAYRPVALALGSGFLWSDLVCYGVGTAAGWGLETVLCRVRWPAGDARPPGESA